MGHRTPAEQTDPQLTVGTLVPAAQQQQLLPLDAAPLPPIANRWQPEALLADWLATRSSRYTVEGFAGDIRHLARYLGVTTGRAIELLMQGQPQAEMIVEHWDAWSRDQLGAAPATRCRRIRAVGSFLRHARKRGAITHGIDVRTPAPIPRKDTTGPDHRHVDSALLEAATSDAPGAPQDAAILGCLYGLALRHGEVLTMRQRDVDPDRRRLMIVGKGRLGLVPTRRSDGSLVDPRAVEPDREQLRGVPDAIWRLMAAHLVWLRSHRPELSPDAPLWWVLTPVGTPHCRLGKIGLQRIITRWMRHVGARTTTPHGLRHASITKLLDRSGGNLRMAAAYARHADLRQLARYDDGRRGLFADGAAIVADAIG